MTRTKWMQDYDQTLLNKHPFDPIRQKLNLGPKGHTRKNKFKWPNQI